MSNTLQDLVNHAVFFSTEMQTHFGGLIAEAEWEVDFTADPHLTFTSEDGVVLRGRPHLLGSESSGQSTWLWGWENINEFPEAIVGLSHEVRKFGAAEEIVELTTPELDLDEELALRLTLASKEATGKWAHYPAAAGAGTTVWLLVDAPELALPEPRVKTTVRALMQGLTQTTVTDHRAALEAYVAKRGVPTAPLPEEGLRLLFTDGSADLSFDEQRRISNCEMNTPLEGEAAEQFAQATGTTAPATADGASLASSSQADSVRPDVDSGSTPRDAARPKTSTPSSSAAAGTSAMDTGTAADTSPAPSEPVPTAESTADSPESTTRGISAADETLLETEDDRSTATTPDEQDSVPVTADEAASDKGTDEASEAERDEPKKKKGLFSKLFGR